MQKLNQTISKIKPLDEEIMNEARKRQDFLTKPKGSLGKLEELSIKVAGITGKLKPVIKDKVIFTLAGDHGVTEEGISAYPKEVTPQMVYNFLRGGAGINVLAKHTNCRVVVVDMGVAEDLEPHPDLIIKKINYGTKNIAKFPAMTKDETIKSIEAGIELVENEVKKGLDILGTGDMGIGNTTPSSAIVSVITKSPPENVTGKGTGIKDDMLKNKVNVIKKAIEINKPKKDDPIDVLSKLGGFEIGGLCGVILAGAANKIPVVIDGFISGAAALVAVKICEKVKDYLIPAHLSQEPGHSIMLKYMGFAPLLDLNMRLGEGTGASLGISIVEAACRILNEMATFSEAGVSEETK
jgi:nicotinate-nucleotide--dimethylbenzimidazole phosphoribosyltransferase